jgi:hypothetical protein
MELSDDITRRTNRLLLIVLALALIAGTGLITYHATGTPTHTIDSYFYLSKAKQLAAGEGLTTTWNNGIDAKYFPGYSVILAPSFLFVDSYVPVQVLCYLLCAALLYLVAREMEFPLAERMLAVIAFAVNPIVIKWLSVPMAEGAATALCLLSACLFLRAARQGSLGAMYLACLVGGGAVLVRAESLFLLAVFGLVVLADKKSFTWRGGGAAPLVAGLALLAAPLAAYMIQLRVRAGEASAYIGEFEDTFLHFDIITNIAYNVWVPFGLMHKAIFSPDLAGSPGFGGAALTTGLAGAAWLLLGGLVFAAGLALSVTGRLGGGSRAAGLLFIAYAVVHALWYYRYERFMLMAVPLAALVWAGAARRILGRIGSGTGSGGAGLRRISALMLLLFAAAGLFLGHRFSVHHRVELQKDTAWLEFQDIANVVNTLNEGSRSAILTDLGPHLAYYIDAHTYLDSGHGNYWQRAFAPDRTLEEIKASGIGLIVTTSTFDEWIDEHKIPVDAKKVFEPLDAWPDAPADTPAGVRIESVRIIKYSPPE